jgi:tRNA-2-methylthio-N6-dimethylallyladenosine synthase
LQDLNWTKPVLFADIIARVKYHIWTEGCQMNSADSMQVSALLEGHGFEHAACAEDADVIILNTCVVRKSAEDKAIGRLTSLKNIKTQHPGRVINLMGCLVGLQPETELKKRFPYVDVFSPPSDPKPLFAYLKEHPLFTQIKDQEIVDRLLEEENSYQLPASSQKRSVSVFVPIVYGCSHACSYCIIPIKRGRERSRPAEKIINEIRLLAEQGVSEVTLLGQIVDRYGMDQPSMPNLSTLLKNVADIDGIQRVRFLTSHPLWMTDELLDTLATSPKLMPHFELPIQAGDDGILRAMRRGYDVERFMRIVEKIRGNIHPVSIATDIIVGFPGESQVQFENTLQILRELRPDMTHVARYSPRPGTFAFQNLNDEVMADEKMRRFREIETLQEKISTEINQHYLNTNVPVLFEEKNKKRWRGRTPTNKLVFVESEDNLIGQVSEVNINWTGPWSMIASLPHS